MPGFTRDVTGLVHHSTGDWKPERAGAAVE